MSVSSSYTRASNSQRTPSGSAVTHQTLPHSPQAHQQAARPDMAKFALGHHREAAEAGCVRAVLAELILTFLFVFAGVGSAMATGKLAGGADSIVGLTAVALAHTLVVAVMVSAGLHVSGGHINPAVTLGLAVSGRITLFRSALYILAQLVGSTLACLLLTFVTGGVSTPVHALAAGVGAARGVVLEAVLTFSLLFTVYATVVDQRRAVGCMGPLLVGLVVGANVLAGGPFSGASMNPARSFGPALAAGIWAEHWVYWVGPLIGGPLAGLVYEDLFMGPAAHEPLPRDDTDF
ncbi:aquaporin TIP4-4-like [Phragmites australis]|uniref:aquaporin TIP4-4-like n=1 Tax=Phragmites australis TaxID=29695 RepID=UPI002D77D81A|nr:aquaporin TIP4-4-like [Phragmites australis]